MKAIMRFLPAAAALAAIVFFLPGCGDSESSSVASAPKTDASATSAGSGIGMGPFAGVTVDDLDARLHLTADQRTQVQAALATLQDARQKMVDNFRQARGQGQGRIGPVGEPPMIGFVEDLSKVLTPDQFKELAQFAAERRDAFVRNGGMRGRMQGRGGPGRMQGRGGPGAMQGRGGPGFANGGFRGAMLGRAAQKLDLTDAQQQEIKPYLDDSATKLSALRSEVTAGTITRDQARDQMRQIREDTRAHVDGVLTPEQRQEADTFRRDRIDQAVDRRLQNMNENLGRRADFLGRVLGLDDAQAGQVKALLLGTVGDRSQILGDLRSGTIKPEDAAQKIGDIEKTTASRIESLLTPEQTERWDAVKELVPGRW